jgi:hypothetical protein
MRMHRLGKILQHLILLFCLIIVGSIFYFLGSDLRQTRYYDDTFIGIIGMALFFCIPSYILYLIIYKLTRANKNVLISSILSVLSFGIVFLLLSFSVPYGADYRSRHVIVNMFVLLFTALSLPYLEMVIRKIVVK